MSIINKQKKTLALISLFIPDWVDWDNLRTDVLTSLKISDVGESAGGMNPEEAFFMRSESGKNPQSVTDLGKFAAYLSGQRWMAAHEKMWREGTPNMAILPSDLVDEPDIFKRFVNKVMKYETA